MVSMLALSVVDRGFGPWSKQTKDKTTKMAFADSPPST